MLINDLVFYTWLGVSVFLIFPLAIWLIRSVIGDDAPETIDWMFGLFIGTLASLLWPLAAAPALSWLIWNHILNRHDETVVDSDDRDARTGAER